MSDDETAPWQAGYSAHLDKKATQQEGEGEGEIPAAALASISIDIQGLTGGKMKTIRRKFTSKDTVATVRQAIKDEIDPGLSETRSLHLNGEAQSEGSTLGSCGMKSGPYTMALVVQTRGGASMPGTAPVYSGPHVFKPALFPALATTSAADALMCIDDSRDPRVLAPCGKHAFTGETYYQLMKRMISKDQFSVRLNCPMTGCGVEIPFEFLKKAAMLTVAEVKFFAMHLGMRAISAKFCKCPGCQRPCDRPDRLDYVRVSCGGGCKDFCFQCGGVWKGGGFQVCGSERCGTYQTQLMIAKAPLITLTAGHKCPKLRACPKCLALIQWAAACKHFRCYACDHYFCFLCLKKAKGDGDDFCKIQSHMEFCELAPRQTIK